MFSGHISLTAAIECPASLSATSVAAMERVEGDEKDLLGKD